MSSHFIKTILLYYSCNDGVKTVMMTLSVECLCAAVDLQYSGSRALTTVLCHHCRYHCCTICCTCRLQCYISESSKRGRAKERESERRGGSMKEWREREGGRKTRGGTTVERDSLGGGRRKEE